MAIEYMLRQPSHSTNYPTKLLDEGVQIPLYLPLPPLSPPENFERRPRQPQDDYSHHDNDDGCIILDL